MKTEPSPPEKGPYSNPDSAECFRKALQGSSPPRGWDAPFRALWWDARGDWEAAHTIAQDLPSAWGSWMHAYLHRKEGDSWNARYWYRMAGMDPCQDPLEIEFEHLLSKLL